MNNEIILNQRVPQNFFSEEIEIEDHHYVLGDGNLQPKILMPDGHGWGTYLPQGETQFKNNIDPSSCPAGGTLNAIETIGKFRYNTAFQNDLSERYLSIVSGMNGNGGNPHQVAEIMRTLCGAIPEVFLPFDSTITTLDKYFKPRPMTYALFKVGYHWMQTYDFKHQWVFIMGTPLAQKQAAIKEALKYSPVGVAGYAWSLHADGKYYHDGPDIHWFNVFDYVEGEYWLAFDTYPPYIKKLDWNYDFGYAKGYSLEKRQKLGGDNIVDIPESCVIPYAIYLLRNFIQIL